MELSAGTRLGPYEIQRRIGAGGMGVVYGALDSRLGRSVAIKVLPAALIDDDDRLRRFEKEARMIGALNHPNLVTLHDVGHHEGAPYLVTELLTGTSLRTRLDSGRLSTRESLRIATEIARGLAAAHGAGVGHRDIKPDNLFLTEDSRVKVLDFGVAKLRRDQADLGNAATIGGNVSAQGPGPQPPLPGEVTATGTGVVIGTPGYMSPEQLAGGEVDARTDLFALGVVMFEMLTGRRPFAAPTHVEESYAIMKLAPAELPASIPAAVARVVMRCLEKRPDARFQAAADLAFALDAISERSSTPSLATPVPGALGNAATDLAQRGTTPGAAPTAIGGPATAEQKPAPTTEISPRTNGPRMILALAALAAVVFIGVIAIVMVGTQTGSRGTSGRAGGSMSPASSTGPGAAWPASIGGGARYRRVSYHTQSEWYARFTRDRKVLHSMQQPDGWRVTVLEPGVAAVTQLDVKGRLLDVSPTGELAVMLDDDTLVTVIPGAGPREVARTVDAASYSPDGSKLAVARRDGNAGGVVEYPVGTAIVRHPHFAYSNVRVSRDGKYIAVVEHDTPPDSRGRLLILDDKGTRVAESQIYPGIEGVAWSPDGGEVWFSEWTDLHAFAAGKPDRVLFQSFLPINLRDVAPDGSLLVAPLDARFGAFVGPLTGPKEQLGWYDAAVIESLSYDGSTLAFLLGNGIGQNADGYTSYVRKGRAAPVPIGNAFGLGLLPDASAIILLTAKPALRYVPLTAGPSRDINLGQVAELDRRDKFVITPDGKRAIVRAAEAHKPMRLYVFDLVGSSPPVPFGPDLPADIVRPRNHPLSPDGRYLALATQSGVRLVPTGDAKPFDIPVPGEPTPLRFAPDGRSLLIQQAQTGTIQRVELKPPMRHTTAVKLDGISPTRWVEATVSGDTSMIAYSFPRETADLYVIEPPTAATQ